MDTGNTSHILGYSLTHFDCQYADRRYNNFKSLNKLELELKHCKRHLTSFFLCVCPTTSTTALSVFKGESEAPQVSLLIDSHIIRRQRKYSSQTYRTGCTV